MKKLILLLVCIGLCGLAPALADVIYVSGDVSGTWSADTVIVEGEIRIPPDSILSIQPGVEVYFWAHCKFIVDNSATLLAVGTPANSIFFDGYWQWPTNGWHGIRFLSASSGSRLEYCHLTNGYANGSGGDENGGAIYCNNSSPTVQNCLIDHAHADGSGGAIYCYQSNPNISNNTIAENIAYSSGGGIYCEESSPTLSGNTISTNSVNSQWGQGGGGIICSRNSHPTISGNTVSANSAEWSSGGGISCSDNSNPTINGNTISGNSSGWWGHGAGIYCSGSNPSISGNTITGNSAFLRGGGIHCSNSSPAISDNTFSGNSAESGGGIWCEGNSNPRISGNTISGNTSSWYGGGIYCGGSSPTISGNTISGNSAWYIGYGGGIYCDGSSLNMSGNTISENSANNAGGGIYCINSNPAIIGNTINANSASSGGGIWCSSAPDTFQYNEISQNSASQYGGGIYMSSTSYAINKCTITDNSASAGGGIYCTISSPILVDLILWGNSPEQICQTSGSNVQVTFSDIQGIWPGSTIIHDDPFFMNPARNDYHLQEDSPCIDTGDPNPIYNDPDGSRADMGCYPYDSTYTTVKWISPREIAEEFALYQNCPNPFNASTMIRYDVPMTGKVSLTIFNLLGQEVATLLDQRQLAGTHTIQWDAAKWPSGVYLCRMEAAGFVQTRKLVLVK